MVRNPQSKHSNRTLTYSVTCVTLIEQCYNYRAMISIFMIIVTTLYRQINYPARHYYLSSFTLSI